MVRTVGGPNHFGLVRTAFPGSNHENLVHPYFFRLLRRVVMYLVRLASHMRRTWPMQIFACGGRCSHYMELFALHVHIFTYLGAASATPLTQGPRKGLEDSKRTAPHTWKPEPRADRRAEAGTRSYNNCSPSCSHAHIPRTPASDARARSSGKQPSLAAVPQPHTFHTGVEYRWRSCWTPKCLI